MSTEMQHQTKGDALKEFTSEIAALQEDLKALTTGIQKQIPAKDGRVLRDAAFERTKRLVSLFKSKGQRRAPKDGAKAGNKGVCQPKVIHPDLRNFFIKAASLGMSHPYNYEFSKTKEFSDPQDVKHEFRLTTESGEVLYGNASCGKGITNKPSKTNVSLLEVIKNIRRGITSSSQLTILFSIYMRINNLKNEKGMYRCDAHMEKYLGEALKYLETTKGFKRDGFKHCNFMQISSFYDKKELEGKPAAKIEEWARKCGLSVAEYTKTRGYTKEDREALFLNGKVRDDIVKAVEEETAIIKQANSFYSHHSEKVREKKERVPKEPKAPKPAKAAAAAAGTDSSGVASDSSTGPVAASGSDAAPAAPVGPKKAAGRAPAAAKASASTTSAPSAAPSAASSKPAPSATSKAPASKPAPVAKPAPAKAPAATGKTVKAVA